MLTRLALLSFLLAPLVHAAPRQEHAPFDQAALERVLAEIMTVAPEGADYDYPIHATLSQELDEEGNPNLNANSGPLVNDARTEFVMRNDKYVPQVTMYQGLVDYAQGDERLLRAVLAHEVAHLAHGHVMQSANMTMHDLDLIFSRQQEREADASGADYLAKLGHPQQDMLDMLHLLDRYQKERGPIWLRVVGSDHCSPMLRAANLSGDQGLLKAVSLFEIGLAFMDCRRFPEAIGFFDQAAATDWTFTEAKLDAASAALQEYFDRLPPSVQEEWLRPDFGPSLTFVHTLGRSIELTDQDRARYQDALARIDAAYDFFSQPMKAFLLATARVLHPTGDEDVIRQGVSDLEGLLDFDASASEWDTKQLHWTIVNNLAVGLQRLGDEARAARLLIDETKRATGLPPVLVENLARLPLDGVTAEDAPPVLNNLFGYLSQMSAGAPGAEAARRALDTIASAQGVVFVNQPTPAPMYLCGVATMTIDGHELGLFQPAASVGEALGAAVLSAPVDKVFPGLQMMRWSDGEVIALAEDGRLLKLTSYREGSFLELVPQRNEGLRTTYRIRVGMSEAELGALLQPAAGSVFLTVKELQLLTRVTIVPAVREEQPDGPKPGSVLAELLLDEPAKEQVEDESWVFEEQWQYYPLLNFGVLLEEGKVAGITVTPVTLPPEPKSSAR